jgi:TRAP-type C4-dicarboxylate transport system permease small subunit
MIDVVAMALASDPRPDDNNVVAGWLGFAVLIGLIVAVVFILRSFTKQLKKVDAAEEAGAFGQEPDDPAPEPPTSIEHNGRPDSA